MNIDKVTEIRPVLVAAKLILLQCPVRHDGVETGIIVNRQFSSSGPKYITHHYDFYSGFAEFDDMYESFDEIRFIDFSIGENMEGTATVTRESDKDFSVEGILICESLPQGGYLYSINLFDSGYMINDNVVSCTYGIGPDIIERLGLRTMLDISGFDLDDAMSLDVVGKYVSKYGIEYNVKIYKHQSSEGNTKVAVCTDPDGNCKVYQI